MRESLFAALPALIGPSAAQAHVSEQGFVLLLPTGAYTVAGVAVVVLTVVALFFLPEGFARGVFAWRPVAGRPMTRARTLTSLGALLVFAFLLYLGFAGPHDPLSNLLPLGFWTVWWIGLIPLAGLVGNLWAWINPWTGLYRLTGPVRPPLTLPAGLGMWPSVVLMAAFACFLLADLAPDDPERLATVLAVYWGVTMAGLMLFGAPWLAHAELGQAIFRTYARLSALRLEPPAGIGGPGWQIAHIPPERAAGAFALTLLAVGSFDGVNETFLWFGWIGVNPLEFPGRSAVVTENVAGLFATILGLMALFALIVLLGLSLARAEVGFATAFNRLAPSLVPIALAYHLAHYLTSFLVNIQYTVAALGDPFETGARWFGIQPFHVSTGFFNRLGSVRLIWLCQGGIVVLGHVWSVLLGHRIAQALIPAPRKAFLATLPLSLLMIFYTFLGLWLLATARGA